MIRPLGIAALQTTAPGATILIRLMVGTGVLRIGVVVTVASLLVLLSGCNIAGPRAIRAGRVSYNAAIQQTNKEQLLLNIVRLRYRDNPYFIEVGSITTSFDVAASAAASITRPRSDDSPYVFGGEVSFSERPTISYQPLTGEKFASQLMTPLDLETLSLLYYSGWSIKRILMVTVQAMNAVPNAPREN